MRRHRGKDTCVHPGGCFKMVLHPLVSCWHGRPTGNVTGYSANCIVYIKYVIFSHYLCCRLQLYLIESHTSEDTDGPDVGAMKKGFRKCNENG